MKAQTIITITEEYNEKEFEILREKLGSESKRKIIRDVYVHILKDIFDVEERKIDVKFKIIDDEQKE